MKIRRVNLGLVDTIGATVVAVVAIAGTTLLLTGPIREARGLWGAQSTCAQATRELDALRTETSRFRAEADAARRQLASIGGGLPGANQVERYLAHVTALASAQGITVDSLVPTPLREREDHREIQVQFTGRGTFPAFHRLLRGIERELDYADVTHLSVSTLGSSDGPDCQMEWSLRIRTSREGQVMAKAVSHAVAP
ncbi:MAG TPA: GspMb/PilO family protein [Phycisphaerae bacterium]|nr:GspMb/PilO family protein [Phycisphaerae bacterium]HRY66890.1 GspMb/PilO family protein [Phycisphaerae bacterium]HSA26949.1 GspMb/PilO family protein [Phycisphaerae bacterium]